MYYYFFALAVIKAREISRVKNQQNHALRYYVTPSVLAYLLLSKVATLKAIYSPLYFHVCISVSQPVRNIGIAVFAGITVFAGIVAFACLRHLNIITSSVQY